MDKKILDNPKNVKFNDLLNQGKMAKAYQVRDVKKAIEKLEALDDK